VQTQVEMEHAKKFVLVDPRFVRPSMRDKTLSGLDADISNILESDASDEMKAKNYAATLSRFKHIYNPPREKSNRLDFSRRRKIAAFCEIFRPVDRELNCYKLPIFFILATLT